MGSVTSYKFQIKKNFSSMQTFCCYVTILETDNRLKRLKLDSLFQRKDARKRSLQGLWPIGLNDAIKSFRPETVEFVHFLEIL